MKLETWTQLVSQELREAGFEVREYEGFPLAKSPESLEEKVRFLKFKTKVPADRTIYAEGVLFTTAGSAARVGR
jgi:hypothetical protein